MKRSKLKEIIKGTIQELLNEESPVEKDAKQKELAAIDAKIKALNIKKGDITSGREEIAEIEIDEMANVAIKYEIAPDADTSGLTGKKARIIAAMQETGEPMSKIEIANAMGYDKQNPINAEVLALTTDGILNLSGQQTAPRLNRPQPAVSAIPSEPGEEDDEDVDDEEEIPNEDDMDGIVNRDLSDEEVDAMFAQTMRGDEEEPEVNDIEVGDIDGAKMSDEDYDAFMKYTDLEDRLAKVKSDILKTKRFKSGPGDLRNNFSSEVQNLRALKDRLQQRMDDLISNSPYLQARKAKLAAKNNPENSGELDEWTKKNLQYYAGIIK
jgi:hypothetical protein